MPATAGATPKVQRPLHTQKPLALIAGVGLQLASGLSAGALLKGRPSSEPRDADASTAAQTRKPGMAPWAFQEDSDAVLPSVAAALDAHWSDGVRTGVLIAEELVSETPTGEGRSLLPAEIVGGTSRLAASLSAHLGTRWFPYLGTVTGALAGTKALMVAAKTLQRSPGNRLLLIAVDSSPALAATISPSPRHLTPANSVALLLEAPSLSNTDEERISVSARAVGKTVRQATSDLHFVPEHIGMILLPVGAESQATASRAWLAGRFPQARIIDPESAIGGGGACTGLVQVAIAATWLQQNPGRGCLIFAGSTADQQVIAYFLSARETRPMSQP